MKFYLSVLSLLFLLHINTNAQIPEMTENTRSVMSSILLNEMELMDYENIEASIIDTWRLDKDDIDGNNQTISFEVDGITYLAAMIPVPLPADGLEAAVELSQSWTDARSALNNKSHVAVAVLGEKEILDLYVEATKFTDIILEFSNASGVYMANQSLVIARNDYLQEAMVLKEGIMPVGLWVYVGQRQSDKGNSAYTYGLKEFGMEELEIVDSENSREDVSRYLKQTAHDLITGNLKIGEKEDESEASFINPALSNGINTDRKTYKLEY